MGSDSDIGRGGKCGQALLVILNIIFIVLGIAAIGLGAWAIATGNNFNFVTASVIGGAALLIIIGGVIVIIAAVGVFGALCKSRLLLIIYALVVLVCVILEIVGGILIIVFRDQVLDTFTASAQRELIQNYDHNNRNNDVGRTVRFIQETFDCCGVVNASDWARLNPDAISSNAGQPPGCDSCDATLPSCATYTYPLDLSGFITVGMFNATTVGCITVEAVARVNTTEQLGFAIGVGAVGIVFGIFEIIGIIVALLLCCCIQREHQQTVV